MEATERVAIDYLNEPSTSEPLVSSSKGRPESPARENQEMIIEHPFGRRIPTAKIITANERVLSVLNEATRVARSGATVLVTGESGTGKELLATEIHRLSRRAKKPWTVINCAALSEQLVETELFGHVKGAFTGAERGRMGFFEAAHGGTVFLDEIGEIGPIFQLKLLRVLEQGEYNRVGDIRRCYTDVRIIAATNQDLEAKVQAGKFRPDLYYRLNVLKLTLPSLRERRDDIGLLTRYFVQVFGRETGKRINWISRDLLDVLESYDWPGNVRELRNVIQRAVILCLGDMLDLDSLPEWMRRREFIASNPLVHQNHRVDEQHFLCSFKQAKEKWLREFEKEYLVYHLRQNRGNVSRTAQQTGLYGANLYEKLRRNQIDPNDYRPRSRSRSLVPVETHQVA